MPFLQQYTNPNLLSDAGGYAGEGAEVSGQQKKTAAGVPGGWYNIQEFLSANSQEPAVKARLEDKANQQLSTAQNTYNDQVKALSPIPEPQAYSRENLNQFLQGGLNENEKQSITYRLKQTYQGAEPGQQSYELTPGEQMPSIASPYSTMKSGEFPSIMQWYGNLERPSAEYTPGQQKMDEMLLRGQPGFSTQFPEKYQSQFQTNVTNPLAANQQSIAGQQSEAPKKYDNTNKQWFQGISDFMGEETGKMKNKLAEQQAELQRVSSRTVPDVYGDYAQYIDDYPKAPVGIDEKPFPGMPEYRKLGITGVNPNQYVSYSGAVTPNMETAANAALTPDQIANFNALSGIVPDAGYSEYGGNQVFNPGTWNLDKQGFESDYKRVMREVEDANWKRKLDDLSRQSAVDIPIQEIGNDNPQSIKEYFQRMGYNYYDIPYSVNTPFGPEQLTIGNRGGTAFRPYNILPAFMPPTPPPQIETPSFGTYNNTTGYVPPSYNNSVLTPTFTPLW